MNMLLKTETYKYQSNFASYCRDGKPIKIPGTKESRLPQYRRLVFNVVKDSLESAYPIAHSFIEPEVWEEMASRFFSEHDSQTPQIWKLPFEFYQFAVEKDFATQYRIPFLHELLHFEWLEIEVFMMEDIPLPDYQENGNWLTDSICFNPEYRLVKLEYPVHLKNPAQIKNEKGDYFLLIFREQESGHVEFVNLSVLFTYLLEHLLNGEKQFQEILSDIIYIFGINDDQLLLNKSITFLQDLKSKGFVLGFKTLKPQS